MKFAGVVAIQLSTTVDVDLKVDEAAGTAESDAMAHGLRVQPIAYFIPQPGAPSGVDERTLRMLEEASVTAVAHAFLDYVNRAMGRPALSMALPEAKTQDVQ